MEEKLVESIDLLILWMQKAGELAANEIPVIVQEIIAFYLVWYCVLFLICLFGVVLFIHSTRKYIKLVMNKRDDDYALHCILSILFLLISTGFLFVSLYWGLMAHFAPRLFIFACLKGLI